MHYQFVQTVNEFIDVFLEELSGLPPERVVEFVIEVEPETALIFITPYRIDPTKLNESKA